MSLIKKVTRKKLDFTYSGRSSDFIPPLFGRGCLLNCTYCYEKRHIDKGLSIATNVSQILTEINNHSFFTTVEKPNQTHEKYITYDISCNEDFALHRKHHDWKRIFSFFRDHPKAMATLATKIVPDDFLEFNPKQKVRIRFSLMPQIMSSIVEPNTALIEDRIKAIDRFIEAGYCVHVNFSPVIFFEGWLAEYTWLFLQLNELVKNKDKVKAEVIFLTHNKKKHYYNKENELPGENFLWTPELQEKKTSTFGGENVRYKRGLKSKLINQFKDVHSKVIPWNTIRYIF